MRLAEIQGIARAGVVGVRVSRIGGQHVIARCIQTLEAVDGSSVVALASVVVDDVEHYPDTGTMKRLYHVSKFKVLSIVFASAGILTLGREKVQRHVAPVVTLLRITLKDRHQLNNCNPEFLEIRNLFHQTGVRASTSCVYA